MIGIELLCKIIFKVSTNFANSCTAFWFRIWQSVIEFIFKIVYLFLIIIIWSEEKEYVLVISVWFVTIIFLYYIIYCNLICNNKIKLKLRYLLLSVLLQEDYLY